MTPFRFALVLLLLGAAGAASAEWSEVLREAQARCEQQHAGMKDVYILQDMITYLPEGEFTAVQRIFQQGKKSRVEVVVQLPAGAAMDSMQTVVIDDGTETWMINSITGKQKLEDAEPAQQGLALECWGFTPENSKLIGEDRTQDRDCYLVELTTDSLRHKLWLDKEGLFVRQGVSDDGSGSSVKWVLSDFHPVFGDYLHPYKIEMYDGETPMTTMLVRDMQINQGMSPDLFDPEQVQMAPVDMQELMRRALQGQDLEIGEDTLAPPDTTE